MVKKNKSQIEAFNPLRFFALFVLMAAATIWVPHTLPFFFDKFNWQMIWLVLFLPLAVLGLFYGDSVGYAFAGLARKWFGRKRTWLGFVMLLLVQAGCEALCIGHETCLAGYPFSLCLNDNCALVELPTAILIYSIVMTLLFLPAYWAAFKYVLANKKITH
jgi:hypothetical protein